VLAESRRSVGFVRCRGRRLLHSAFPRERPPPSYVKTERRNGCAGFAGFALSSDRTRCPAIENEAVMGIGVFEQLQSKTGSAQRSSTDACMWSMVRRRGRTI
jgi:hypothetical protein